MPSVTRRWATSSSAIVTDGASLLQTTNMYRTLQTNRTHFLSLPSSYISSTLVSVPSFPSPESRMTTWDLIIALFYHVEEQLHDMPKHPEAHLWPSEVVTLGLLHALKGVGNLAFHRWLTRDYRALFPRLPER